MINSRDVLNHFIPNNHISSVRLLAGGAINCTYLVHTDEGDFIIQSMNSFVFVDSLAKIERNYISFVSALQAARAAGKVTLSVPEWIPDQKGRYIWTDSYGTAWRVYPFIKGEPLSREESKDAEEEQGLDRIEIFAHALAEMHRILSFYQGKPETVIPDFHRLDLYYDSYTEALRTSCESRRDDLCETVISENIEYILENCICEDHSVIHGDTKIDNVLYDKAAGTAAFIDLDTISSGSVLIDVADSVRSILCGGDDDRTDEAGGRSDRKGGSDEVTGSLGDMQPDAAADGPNAHGGPNIYSIDFDAANRFVSEYYKASRRAPTEEEKKVLMNMIMRMPFELGLRFYTDHLKGNVYFPAEHDGQNLLRAKRQFAVFSEIQGHAQQIG